MNRLGTLTATARFLTEPLIALAALVALSAWPASAAVISVNIRESDTDVQKIDADETFGVGTVFGVNTTVGGWINTNSTSLSNLATNTGPSTVNFASTQPNGQATFNAAYNDTPLLAGFDDFTTSSNKPSVTFSNLNANFTDGYFVIVYLTGFNGNTGASISDGTTTFYYQTLSSPSAPVSLVQTTQTTDLGAGNNPFAQYAIFGSDTSPLTADTITLTIRALSGGGAGLGGVQLIAVPEPASAALLTGIASVGLLARRRRLA